ncbi:SDR family NAD(P)-dependent oxidoreductase [Streptomyces sp. NEAU-W12]|uniref:SDR family NAD(P)-dependent oxidoreductase n=1 Tax=Streptomyces sp. NEAU-W12 TaxID=2994668 RepID=UPI00224A786D|nr:SDR family NAD(P)-dependent oxidoreductase [Streptomyces sp. NEAU-W12]MCX2924138.1 SDR family NAD(P)-dependent oxidoreductase [Streptomyces sp. NEAU-W12]
MNDALVKMLLDLKANRISKEQFKEAVNSEAPRASEGTGPDLVRLGPVWERAADATAAGAPGHVVLFAGERQAADALRGVFDVRLLETSARGLAERYTEFACQVLETVRRLLADPTLPRTLVQLVCPETGDDAPLSGLFAMVRTAALENPKVVPQLVLVDPEQRAQRVAEQVLEARNHADASAVRWRDGERQALAWRELPAPARTDLPWKEGGTYVITGGLGGLGLIFAEDLLRSVRSATLYLTGRSPLDGERVPVLEALSRPHAQVCYARLDVADTAAVEEFVAGVGRDHGSIDGIIHSAGVTRDGLIRTKSAQALREVLAPKVTGTVNLDRASRDLALDFFVTFSSGAAVTGNTGQADYATANAFMDAFAHHRDALAASGRRSGRSLSVNWPLWAEGGMTVDEETARALHEDLGMAPLRTESGIRVLHEFLLSTHSQVMAVEGDGARIRRAFTAPPATARPAGTPAHTAPALPVAAVAEDELREKVVDKLARMLGAVTGLRAAQIDAGATLESHGVDSIVVTRLNRKLAEVFPGLSAALLYEYNSLDSLGAHFVAEHREQCLTWTGAEAARPVAAAPAVAQAPAPAVSAQAAPAPVVPVPAGVVRDTPDAAEAVAVIGMSGRFPGARNLDEYWENLAEGRDCVSEVPPQRWDLTGFFHANRDEAVARGLSYSKWGGFLEGFADFDPLFFAISPHEAMSMDPQERLFLQESWNALEDAGYTRRRLADLHGGRVGVFAGVSKTGFELYGPGLWEQGENLHPVTSFAAVANRVSYFLDLKGPSLAIDTMCSSSLSAVHEAMEHLRRGECDAAIAGGVNLYAHPSSYVLMSRVRMLSDDGKCRSFGAGGTGFVPGEGVAVLLLKRLADARRDGDVIHAVLRGSSINHGGRTHGYTVPNPASQAEAVREAMDRAGVSAHDIGYVETHGTGTSLGDPIEIAGLSRAFAGDAGSRQYCAIGSAKSNIGHLEAAAGVAGLVKVVLQLRHGKIAPSLHAQELNPEIDFGPTPFRVQRELAEWKRPAAVADGAVVERNRVAGISSFGAGGSNAHVIVEEYRATAAAPDDHGPQLIVLSAKDRARLRERAGELAGWLGRGDTAHPHLADVAYTLQVGREAMESRLALRVASSAELTDKLTAFAAGDDDVEGLHLGDVKQHRETLALLTADSDMASTVGAWIGKGKFTKLMDLWVKGLAFDWETLPRAGAMRRVSLPSYPFAKERYWVGDVDTAAPRTGGAPSAGAVHPLAQVNSSTLEVQRFDSVFSGDEFFLRDHVVRGERVLPGVAYVEMARAAVAASADGADRLRLRNVVWARPVKVADEPVRVRTTLVVEPGGEVRFTVTTSSGADGDVVHSQGAAALGAPGRVAPVDVAGVRAACDGAVWDAERCYALYRSLGLDYGPGHRGVESVAVGEGQALARLRLSAGAADVPGEFVVHPGLMDSALQATVGLLAESGGAEDGALFLPFAVDEVEILAPFRDSMWAWVRYSADDHPGSGVRKLDIDVCDDDGVVSCRFTGFSTRAYGTGDALEPRQVPAHTPDGTRDERVCAYLAEVLAAELRLDADRFDVDDAFEVYGIDSIMTMNLTNKLEQEFGSLPKTLLFEYQSIRALAGYFATAHEERLAELLGVAGGSDGGQTGRTEDTAADADAAGPVVVSAKRPLVRAREAVRSRATGRADVAIVGVAGQYPGASNVREFWRNLVDGRNCVTEIPADRWDHSRYYDADKHAAGRTYAKWGGFLDGADRFDALFFNISPREAEFMDPQERLFLECVQETFQDAGYTRPDLSRHSADGLGGNVGVFVGVMYEEYQLYGAQEQARGRNIALSGNPSSIANRVSYFFDLHGPSMAVDTMCSSSLTALHLACQSLVNAECEVAVAGGVNLSLHPNKFLMLGSGKWASSRGLCESFGADGDGYVPGEGVGAVLLKPLDRAEADGDTVHGVIRGTAVNHGGKTNGYSVPNPRAQAKAIGRALSRAGVDARDVSYVEAHGTGTSLGDPIEIAGLTNAFREYADDHQFCAIGSVKSNIGHAESAAGIAGLTKVLLQMKHGQLVPSLHSDVLNPHIDFANSPFTVQRSLAEWTRPRAADGTESPRIAGVSSFGAGGSNAHVIVEEYVPAQRFGGEPDTEVAIVLSARTEAGLRDQAGQLLEWIDLDGEAEALSDVAYTLQTGRDAFEERLGLVVADTGELTRALRGFLAGKDVPGLYRAKAKRRGGDSLRVFAADEDMARALDAWIGKKKYGKLLELWVAGLAVDWAKLHAPGTRRRISLPTYPFQRERYWPSLDEDRASLPGAARLHPLVHTNTSSLAGQRFSSVFTGDEFFLADHRVSGDRVLSGAACLELVRAAVAVSLDGEPHGTVRLTNVAWTRPVVVGQTPLAVHVRLSPGGGDGIAFEVYSHPGQDPAARPVIHSEGMVLVPPAPEGGILRTTVDLAGLRARCRDVELDAGQVYGAFAAHGIDYGPGHRGIQRLWAGEGQAVARLVLPDSVGTTLGGYGLHPALVDSALQAAVGVTADADGTPHLPFAVDEVEIAGDCARSMWAWVRPSGGRQEDSGVRRLDIDLCDDNGTVALRLKGLSVRAYSAGKTGTGKAGTGEAGAFLAAPHWVGDEHRGGAREGGPATVTAVVGLPGVADVLEARAGARVVRLESGASGLDGRFSDYAAQLFGVVREVLAERSHDEVCVQVVAGADGQSSVWSGLAGVVRTAALENPRVTGQVVLVEPWEEPERAAGWAVADRAAADDAVVRYRGGAREVLRWRELPGAAADGGVPAAWQDAGVYLITGGAGGLGVLFARDIAARVRGARIVLTGRGPLDESREAVVAELRASGAEATYEQVDVTDRAQVEALVRRVRDAYGRLDGVLHSAGVIRDGFILKKSRADFDAVLAPKVTGLVNLDEATRDVDLGFLVPFSSVAGVSGNVGQADYAAANAFMDAFAAHRNTLVARGERRGRTLSVNWPLWAEGGMGVDAGTERAMRENFGMVPLRTPTGIDALHRALTTGEDQVMVLEGDTERFASLIGAPADGPGPAADDLTADDLTARAPAADEPASEGGEGIERAAVAYLTKLLSSVINLPAARIDPEASLEDYGIDSVMAMDLTRALEEVFGSLSKTLLFEYQSIEALAGHFVTAHPQKVRALLPVTDGGARAPAAADPAARETAPAKRGTWRERAGRPRAGAATEGTAPAGPADIAIIGLAGRYPQAHDVHGFWRNLADGKDCVTEIPAERWEHERHFDAGRRAAGKAYSKWGGFVDGAYEFDPLFFNISPREAEIMDPQERLFLQCVYETLEDAGYVRESVKTRAGNVLKGRVGVFVGVMYEEYQLYGAQSQALGDPLAVSGSAAAIANRVSYFCNFHGPSMSVDTMCSSSLTSIHLACRSIRWGDCDVAVAGGVNLSLHPNKYLLLSTGNFVSSSGRCESFGAGGDGYVPGEGVGAVLLKPLAKAVADGDRIYGVIKGTALNHGGKTNGYTVPNPHAQAGTIADALNAAGVSARDVGYVEAHGTGTSLGDPIEITGLSKAFREHTQDNQFCAIGSVKSNIGHAESAAGIAGLTKVLLQLRHRKLAPSLHAETLNPNIDFTGTPFTVQRELADWPAPDPATPRIAGVSSFGAGGSNAHVIVAEYLPAAREHASAAVGPVVVPLSARTGGELRDVVRNLVEWLTRPGNDGLGLADVAYTLQVGREPLAERLGVLATSVPDLVGKLRHVLAGTPADGIVRSGARDENGENTVSALFSQDADLDTLITAWVAKGRHEKLLELWVNGVPVDWHHLHPDGRTPRRVALPTYPFGRERYFPFGDRAVDTRGPRVLHPLVHENTSDLTEQRFTSVFTGHEPFLRDHVVNGAKLMPGAALLEMAVAATCITCRTQVEPEAPVALKNVALAQPLHVSGEPREVHIGLHPQADGDIGFRVYSTAADAEPVVHGEGAVYLAEGAAQPVLDLRALRDACDRAELTAEECYEAYGAAGIDYGPTHRGVRHIWIGRDQALAQLALPAAAHGTQRDYTVHPSLVDAALQASVGVAGSLGARRGGAVPVPFAIDDVLVLDGGTAAMWALVRPSADQPGDAALHKVDVDLADDQGRVRVRIGGLSFRALEGQPTGRVRETADVRALLHPQWQTRPVTNAPPEDADVRRTVLLVGMPEVAALLPVHDNAVVLTSGDKELDRRYTAYGLQALEHVRSVLRGASAGRASIQLVIGQGPASAPLAGLVGLLRTATLENPNVSAQVILLEETDTPESAAERVRENRAHLDDTLVRYADGRREVPVWIEDGDTAAGVPPVPWRENGVYLLTGGAGALGLVFAREIATRTHSATLVLTGRSPVDARVREALRELRAHGASAHYVQLDVADAAAVDAVVDALVEEHGRIDGVVHAAGVTRDGYILTKRAQDFAEVLAPKVSGAVNLDRATATLPLDFFVTFSSTTGAFGNAGQADYAAANAFLDAYTWHRQDLVARRERSGHSLSVNWPLWEDGGMDVTPEVRSVLRSRYGVVPLDTAVGVAAFLRAVASTHHQVMVASGPGRAGAGGTGSSAARPSSDQSSPFSSAAGTNQ